MARAASVLVLGIAGLLAAPSPATAAPSAPPAPAGTCDHTERYGGWSGAQLLQLNRLDPGPLGGDGKAVTGLVLGEALTALVAPSTVNSAAVARVGQSDEDPLVQQAPPTNQAPATRSTAAGRHGPVAVGAGTLSGHAQWKPDMACGRAAGEGARAETTLTELEVPGDEDAMVATAGEVGSRSTMAFERSGAVTRTVATASMTGSELELFGGKVHLRIVRAPSLRTSMSTKDGGEVRYLPAVVEVSGLGDARLELPGDSVEIPLEPTTPAPDGQPALPGLPEAARAEPAKGGTAKRLLPTVPDLPPLGGTPEAAPIAGPGTILRISLGDVQQATRGHAVAARAASIKIAVTRGRDADRTGSGYAGVALDLDLGILEAASVAPEAVGAAATPGTPAPQVGGVGGGLPITGPRIDLMAIYGGLLLALGTAVLVAGSRRRRRS